MLVSDFKYEDKTTKEDIAFGVSFLKKRKLSAATRYCMIANGKSLKTMEAAVCHAGTAGIHNFSCMATACKVSSDQEPFFKWFTEKSFAAPFLLWFDKDYGIVISGAAPRPVFVAAQIISRHFQEVVTEAFKVFNQMVFAGILPEVAYLFTMNTSLSSSLFKPSGVLSSYSGHRAWGLPNLAGIQKFISQDFLPDDEASYAERPKYYGVVNLLSYSIDSVFKEMLEKNTDLHNALREHRGLSTEEGYRPPNPFVKGPTRRPFDITFAEFETVFIPWMAKQKEFTSNAS